MQDNKNNREIVEKNNGYIHQMIEEFKEHADYYVTSEKVVENIYKIFKRDIYVKQSLVIPILVNMDNTSSNARILSSVIFTVWVDAFDNMEYHVIIWHDTVRNN
jgi:hypothetical protein